MFSGYSIKIGQIAGIPIKLHWSFGLIIFYVILTGLNSQFGFQGTLWFGLIILSLFVCVVLHELGHALTARVFGVKTVDIILLPIGGVARLTHLPKRPLHEFLIAIGGPAVNLVIAAVVSLVLWVSGIGFQLRGTDDPAFFTHPANYLPIILILNITLFVFNLIPAFPMDGGRILRSLLAVKLGRLRATRIATLTGQAVAVMFVVYAVMNGQLMLGLIGVFVFFTASGEYKSVLIEHKLKALTLADVLRTNYTVFSEFDSAATALNYYQHSLENQFLVINQFGQISGILSESAILNYKKNNPAEETQVWQLMHTNWEPVDLQMPLTEAVQLMNLKSYTMLPVFTDNELKGVIDQAAIQKVLS